MMVTVRELVLDHLEYTFEKEAWQPPLSIAVSGLTAAQAAWKPSPERHSIWQIVRHVIHWKRGVLQALAGDPPDFERMTEDDWQEAAGDQAAWEADVQALHDIYAEFRRELEALDDEGLQRSLQTYRQASPQPITIRLMRAFTHDIYHAGQIQYLRALQGIPADRFFTAAWDGDRAHLRDALDADPDLLNAHNVDGWTALQIAAHTGQADAVRFLLDRGADISVTSKNSMATTALHSAIAGWRAGRRAGVTAILLDRGADPGATDSGGNTPLHLAAREGVPEIVELLLTHDAQLNPRRDDGQTPLTTALREGHQGVADLLRRYGAVE